MKSNFISKFSFTLAALFALTACGTSEAPTEESQTNETAVEQNVEEENKAEETTEETEDEKEEASEEKTEVAEAPNFEGRTLNVVATSDSYVPLFDEFTKETGADVEFLSMSSGEVISRTKAEGKAMADLWFGGGLDAFMAAKDDGLLEEYNSDMTYKIPEEYKDVYGYYFSKGLTVVGFVVNNSILEEKGLEAPKTWKDLADPKYKGEVIMSNPVSYTHLTLPTSDLV